MRFLAIISSVAVAVGLAASRPAQAIEVVEVLRAAEQLNAAACDLHHEAEDVGAGRFAFESICRLESSTESLLAKLRQRDPAGVEWALHETEVWYERVTVAARSDRQLISCPHAVHVVNDVGGHLAETRHLVNCWITHPTDLPQVRHGHSHGSGFRGLAGYGNSQPYPPAQASPWGADSPFGGFSPSCQDRHRAAPREDRHFGTSPGPAGTPLPPGWYAPAPGFPPAGFGASRPNGEAGRAILGAVLSELLK